jgi:GSH-dependent disulfide-bond oxidoreductase
MIKLYAFATPNNLKVAIALEELSLDYEINSVNIRQSQQKTDGFKKLNPNGKVPVIDDHGFVLTESAAILVYLAEKEDKFLPTSGPSRARVFEQLFLHASGVSPAFGNAGFFQKLASENIPFAIDRFMTEAKRLMALLDSNLSQHEYMAGSEYSIADMAHFGWIWRSSFVGLELAHYPNVEKWYSNVLRREPVQTAIKKIEALVTATS